MHLARGHLLGVGAKLWKSDGIRCASSRGRGQLAPSDVMSVMANWAGHLSPCVEFIVSPSGKLRQASASTPLAAGADAPIPLMEVRSDSGGLAVEL